MAIVNTIRAWNSYVLIVNAAPDVAGASAGLGSIAINSNGAVYIKTGPLDTDWTLAVTPSAGTVPIVEYRELTLLEAVQKELTLSSVPTDSSLVQMDVISGGPQQLNYDYSVIGSTLSWNGLALDGILSQGNKLRISYFTF